jgi:predicted alpha/beta-hydrolase family hydrolase
VSVVSIETPYGTANAHLRLAEDARGALVLGHGAGGGIASRDLEAATGAALGVGASVVLVEQPYRVAGRRSPAPARQLDEAWTTVVEHLGGDQLEGLPLVVGGRSLGARVACRTAEGVGAVGVLCLAFPLIPPRRRSASAATSRFPELEAVSVPVLVVQGSRDPFGIPPTGPLRTVTQVPGDHSLRADPGAVASAVAAWLPQILARLVTP